MKVKLTGMRIGVPLFFVFMIGCTPATFEAGRQIMSGRNALLMRDPAAALPSFQAITESDPNYINCTQGFCVGIWTYLGRTYHELGNNQKALESLKRGKGLHESDRFNAIYLGLVMAGMGEAREGKAVLDAGLKDLGTWLAGFAGRGNPGRYWDPGRHLQRAIADTQKSIQGDPINWRSVDRDIHRLALNFEQEVRDVSTEREEALSQDVGR